jgi:hypothetical protein
VCRERPVSVAWYEKPSAAMSFTKAAIAFAPGAADGLVDGAVEVVGCVAGDAEMAAIVAVAADWVGWAGLQAITIGMKSAMATKTGIRAIAAV